ncbi:type II toxin-antitoxin system Phd/YefM family antitoxin [Mycolicibacter longobardus]|uniref:Antitoxin n=1 Tax=Mycolicibacter longobardus TaxID=1108812 RepID=A0A1X1Y9B6_9MYCO|nr:antitoxin [Mycolicibacter longobardus]ORW07697.1 antitoxin [Mycolicibacter longobardus]
MGAETVNVYDAKTRLSRLLAQVEGGAEIVISLWKDKVTIAAEFDRFSDSDDRDWHGA